MSGRLWLDRRLMEDVFADSAKPQAGDTLETPDDLSGAILRSLSANVAVLDRRGVHGDVVAAGQLGGVQASNGARAQNHDVVDAAVTHSASEERTPGCRLRR